MAVAVDGMRRQAKLVMDWKAVVGLHRNGNEGTVRPGRGDLDLLETEGI